MTERLRSIVNQITPSTSGLSAMYALTQETTARVGS